ncbi:unnamed protein product [Arabis nemorensis]|uniref:Uncharacterized protein n=1 Tax=Arabis nemorensis TaxID=586526 RepID=A0A565BXZ9_9BRAS|nr:unnamed protein product [Arabis nemorensis]
MVTACAITLKDCNIIDVECFALHRFCWEGTIIWNVVLSRNGSTMPTMKNPTSGIVSSHGQLTMEVLNHAVIQWGRVQEQNAEVTSEVPSPFKHESYYKKLFSLCGMTCARAQLDSKLFHSDYTKKGWFEVDPRRIVLK